MGRLLTLLGGNRGFSVASAATVTPSLGLELLTNGNFAAWTGDNPDSWSAPVEDANNYITEVAGALRLVSDNSYAINTQQAIAVAANTFLQASVNVIAVVAGYARVGFTGKAVWTSFAYNTTGIKTFVTLITDATPIAQVIRSGVCDSTIDDYSLKAITMSSLLADVKSFASSGAFITAWPTQPTNDNVIGMMICLDNEANPQNYIMAMRNATHAYLHKVVNGVYASLIGITGAAWVNGAELKVVKAGSSVSLYYNNVQIGTTQTVSDVTGVKCAWFTTNGSLKPTYWRGY